ncbi:unnamed protein product, partial [Callosobruchus maculatus]
SKFQAYRPAVFGFVGSFCIQAAVASTHTLFIIIPYDMVFMILIRLTALQFRMVNKEWKTLFDADLSSKKGIEEFRGRFRRCIKHYDFLLQYTKTINDRYSLHLAVILFAVIVGNDIMEIYRIANAATIESAIRSVCYVAAGVLVIFLLCFMIPAQELTDEVLLLFIRLSS